MSGRAAAFLDRDGVINRDAGYVHRAEDLQLLPGAAEGLRLLHEAGCALIVVTNQSGIARGMYTEVEYQRFHAALEHALAADGVTLTATYFCPHLEDAAVPQYARDCGCRKPRPGMVLRGLREHAIDARKSFIVGDKASDIEAGRAAGLARCYLVAPSTSTPMHGSGPGGADSVHASLLGCVRHVLANPIFNRPH